MRVAKGRAYRIDVRGPHRQRTTDIDLLFGEPRTSEEPRTLPSAHQRKTSLCEFNAAKLDLHASDTATPPARIDAAILRSPFYLTPERVLLSGPTLEFESLIPADEATDPSESICCSNSASKCLLTPACHASSASVGGYPPSKVERQSVQVAGPLECHGAKAPCAALRAPEAGRGASGPSRCSTNSKGFGDGLPREDQRPLAVELSHAPANAKPHSLTHKVVMRFDLLSPDDPKQAP